MNAAVIVNDLDLPGYNLHALKGDQEERWAITVQANWRLTFEFHNSNVEIIDYEDYH